VSGSSNRMHPLRRRGDFPRLDPNTNLDAHVASSIPPAFLWAADGVAMVAAFLLDLLILPSVHQFVAPGGSLHLKSLDWLLLPGGRLTDVTSLDGVWVVLALTMPVTISVINLLGGYRNIGRFSRTRVLVTSFAGPLAGLSALALTAFSLRSYRWSRMFVFLYTALSGILIAGWHLALRDYRARRIATGRYARATAFVGDPADIARAIGPLSADERHSRYRLVGFFRVGPEAAPPGFALADLGPVRNLRSTLVHTPIDLMIVVVPNRDAPWFDDALAACDYLRVSVQVIPAALLSLSSRLQDLQLSRGPAVYPVPGIVLQPWEAQAGGLFFKRAFDVVVAATLLVVLSPLFVIIAIAIKMTTPKERVFYPWRVIGYQGRPFTGYKFTTMVADADERRSELMHLNEMTGPVFKIKDDPRTTRLGRLLRKYSLNELPQLWSVLTGDMSLVGPRPAGSWEIGNYQDWHKRKLSVRPGITCLWQIRGRNKISSFDDWVRMDLEYINSWSFWLDMKILFRTAWVVVAGSGS
jgi:exopolysaccharide biosynthesis polyprenyl glycosylphosphotransferase